MSQILSSERSTRTQELDHLEMVLASLCLASDDFTAAMNHLANARMYFRQGEIGAARFEAGIVAARIRQETRTVVKGVPKGRSRG